MEWNKTYGGEQFDSANSLIVTSDGGYALACWSSSFGAGDDDFWLVKTDVNGNIEWNQIYSGTGDDFARSLVKTFDGGYALAGDTKSFGTVYSDFWLVKTDELGIPEFPSWIILPILIVSTFVVIVIRNKIRKKELD